MIRVVTQGKTLDEVTANVREVIALHLEDEDPEAHLKSLGLARDPAIATTVELDAEA